MERKSDSTCVANMLQIMTNYKNNQAASTTPSTTPTPKNTNIKINTNQIDPSILTQKWAVELLHPHLNLTQ